MSERKEIFDENLETVCGGKMSISYDGNTGVGVLTSTATGATYSFNASAKASIYTYLYSMAPGTTEAQAVNDLLAQGLIG